MDLLEHIKLLAVAVLVTALGVLMLVKPHWLWKADHWWDTVGGEPSDWYLTLMRVGGTLLIIFGGLFTLWMLIALIFVLFA